MATLRRWTTLVLLARLFRFILDVLSREDWNECLGAIRAGLRLRICGVLPLFLDDFYPSNLGDLRRVQRGKALLVSRPRNHSIRIN